jgi:ribosome biogenesis GTPase
MLFHDGLVVGHEKNLYRLSVGGRHYAATMRGRLQFQAADAAALPVIGDVVRGQISGERAVIEGIEPRRSLIARQAAGGKGAQPLAANVDFVLIATSLNQDLNFNRLDRYLTLAFDSGAQPVLVLTKRDLNPDWAALKAECETRAPGVAVAAVSAQEEGSWAQLAPFVSEGKAAVLLGSSGVGKSTLTNRLLGSDLLDTGGIRFDDDKGRHTTTSRSMWPTHTGGWIIDTPGMRELQMLDHEEGLARTFADVEELFGHCRFRDCNHFKEPGCAVKAALEEGALAWERWESYGKLQREIDFQSRKAARKR